MEIQLAAQRAKLRARAAIQNCFGHAKRPAKSSYDPTDGRYLHLAGSIAHDIYGPIADLPPDRHPALVYRNTRALKFDRIEFSLFKETFEMTPRVRSVFAD